MADKEKSLRNILDSSKQGEDVDKLAPKAIRITIDRDDANAPALLDYLASVEKLRGEKELSADYMGMAALFRRYQQSKGMGSPWVPQRVPTAAEVAAAPAIPHGLEAVPMQQAGVKVPTAKEVAAAPQAEKTISGEDATSLTPDAELWSVSIEETSETRQATGLDKNADGVADFQSGSGTPVNPTPTQEETFTANKPKTKHK